MEKETKRILSKLAKNLKELRKEKNYTQEYVSEQTGIHLTTYQHYEGYKPVEIKVSNLCKLAKFFKVSIDSLLQ